MKDFNKLETTILGNIGETFLNEFAKSKGMNMYQPTLN